MGNKGLCIGAPTTEHPLVTQKVPGQGPHLVLTI